VACLASDSAACLLNQAVDHQRDILGALKAKLEAQHLTLVAVGEQRDAAKAEAATLVRPALPPS
jgi:hypothetical protein